MDGFGEVEMFLETARAFLYPFVRDARQTRRQEERPTKAIEHFTTLLLRSRADHLPDNLLNNHDVHGEEKRVERLLIILDQPEEGDGRPSRWHVVSSRF